MKLERLELREIRMRLRAPFETSFGVTTHRRIILVRAQFDGAWGIGEVACGEEPGYNHEATDTAWIVLRDFLAPGLIGRDFTSPAEVAPLLHHARGNYFAKGAIEMAFFDAFARAAEAPLWRYLGGTRTDLEIGLSVGIKASPDALKAFVTEKRAMGYRRIKLKIAPGRDLAFVAAAREALGPGVPLTVDANSAYTLSDTEHLKALDAFGLLYVEQPMHYDDIVDHATLARQLATPICLDEPIHSVDDVRKAHALGSGKVINLKLGRVAGYTQALKIAAFCGANGLGLWCGGMLESGVGRAHNVALQTLAAFNHASDTAPSQNYWDEDIVEPEITMTDGVAHPLEGAGIGVALRDDLVHSLTARVETLG